MQPGCFVGNNRRHTTPWQRQPALRLVDSTIRASFLTALLAWTTGWGGAREVGAQEVPAASAPVPASEPARFYDHEPFDELRLTEGDTVRIIPLLPNQLPQDRKPSTKLTVRLPQNPDQEYTILWGKIEKHLTFPQLILEKAEQAVAAEDFDGAYDYYQYLARIYPRLEGLPESHQRWLFQEATAWHRRGNPAQVLAMLRELHRLNPGFPNLEAGLAAATDQMVANEVKTESYATARTLLANLRELFPENAIAKTWEQRLQKEAQTFLNTSQEKLQQDQLHEAREAAYQAVKVWPLPKAVDFLTEAQELSPRVVVGVTAPAVEFAPAAIDSFASRRVGGLLESPLLEFAGPAPRGGRYRSALGSLEKQSLGRSLVLRLNPDLRYSNGEVGPTGYDVCRQLVRLADPSQPGFRADWAALFESCRVESIYTVHVTLRQSHVHPDGMLQTVLPAKQPGATLGAYTLYQQGSAELRFRINPNLATAGARQPAEIIERYFPESRDALRALQYGDVAAIDRVNPWEVPALRQQRHLRVSAYAVPSVHVLVPNQARPLLDQRSYRRALLLAIHRQAILDQILDGAVLPGCQVLSAPLPAGIEADDPIGYAYDRSLTPRAYLPRLALTLGNLSLQQENARRVKRDEPVLKKLPELVIVHPATDIARVACGAIQKRFELLKIATTLRELPAGQTRPTDSDYDLLYAEWIIGEPVTDLRALFGPGGLAPHNNPYLEAALMDLDRSQNWKQARERLHVIHRLLHEDETVLPLWQIVDHFAWNQALEGVMEHPVSLYQEVERWQSPPAILNPSIASSSIPRDKHVVQTP